MKALTFSDVLIKPKYSEIKSRKDVSLFSDFGLFGLHLPIVSANMKTITGPLMAYEMYKNGGLGVLHRFNTIEEAIDDLRDVFKMISEDEKTPTDYDESKAHCYKVGVSIGVQEEDKKRFDKLVEWGARIIVLDVAHGHHINVKNMLKWIDSVKGNSNLYIIAGNVATSEGACDLVEWGASCVKAGIGSGKACMTRKNTGCGIPQLYALEDIYNGFKQRNIKCQIISDGGIEYEGDFSKSLRYSDAIMCGKFLSGVVENPGPVFKNSKGEFYKVYAGSASGESKYSNGQTTDFVEGIAMEVPFRGKVKYILKSIREGVQSAFSYVGAKNIREFREKCEFVEISSGGKAESKMSTTHR